jgi:glycosyltransferase involved in cell wall biosynthesis
MKTPLLTAIVSTYNAERFMQGCMEDLVRQTVFPDLEVLVIDSGSLQGEAAICGPYVKKFGNIRYLRTEREGLYAAWNRALHLARGEFISNANTDDRHRADAYEVLVGALRDRPEAPLAYGDQFLSNTENETFEACAQRGASIPSYPEFSPAALLLGCMTGSQPVWRRSVHERCGYFDPAITIAGDRDFWLRCVQIGDFVHLRDTLGVCYVSPDTLSGAGNTEKLNQQDFEIMMKYLALHPWRNMPGMKPQVAMRVLGIGYHLARARRMAEARRYFLAAWRLHPLGFNTSKTLLLRGLLGVRWGLG